MDVPSHTIVDLRGESQGDRLEVESATVVHFKEILDDMETNGRVRRRARCAKDAAGLIQRRSPEVAQTLDRIEMLPLIRITAFYPAGENTIVKTPSDTFLAELPAWFSPYATIARQINHMATLGKKLRASRMGQGSDLRCSIVAQSAAVPACRSPHRQP